MGYEVIFTAIRELHLSFSVRTVSDDYISKLRIDVNEMHSSAN